MSTDTEKKFGRRPDDILEGSGGGLEGRAYQLSELAGDLEAVMTEFHYDETPIAADLVARCAELGKHLEGIFLTEDAQLTADAECLMCGGEGKYNTKPFPEEPAIPVTCEDCGGTGLHRRAD